MTGGQSGGKGDHDTCYRSRYTAAPINSRDKRKVAGYARVSTDHEEQQTSYEAQVDYYTNYIKGREDWEFVSVYTDEGISATSTTKRDGFNKMVADALDGRIDLIITKSVSRFARNTVDSLTTILLYGKSSEECGEMGILWNFLVFRWCLNLCGEIKKYLL